MSPRVAKLVYVGHSCMHLDGKKFVLIAGASVSPPVQHHVYSCVQYLVAG